MNLPQASILALNSIQANKLRSILTTLGIIIGVTTIIGMNNRIRSDFKAL